MKQAKTNLKMKTKSKWIIKTKTKNNKKILVRITRTTQTGIQVSIDNKFVKSFDFKSYLIGNSFFMKARELCSIYMWTKMDPINTEDKVNIIDFIYDDNPREE